MPNFSDGHVVTSSEFNSLVPVGMVLPFAGTAPPTGWLVCDGSAVSRTVTYADLFAAIGTTHGSGDGSTTFNLPNLQGRAIFGKNTGTFTPVGHTGGEETHTLTTTEMPSHIHTVIGSTGNDNATHTHSGTTSGSNISASTVGVVDSGTGPLFNSGVSGDTRGSISGHTHTITTGTQSANHQHSMSFNSGATGLSGAHNTLPPYMALLYCIRY